MPGPLNALNDLADSLTKITITSAFEKAQASHSLHHQNAFALCIMIKNVLDPRHEAVRQPMGETVVVGGGSPLSAQIIFSAIDEEKEGDCALPPEEGEDLQDAAAGCPGEPPPALHKPLKTYPPLSDLRPLTPPPFRLPGPRSSPLCPQSLPKRCLRLRKIKGFLNKGTFKTDACTICRACSLEKTPSGGPHPG